MGLNSSFWTFLEQYVYRMPEPPPRVRTKPMEVIYPGLSRSATESLQQALMILGYDYTYHVSMPTKDVLLTHVSSAHRAGTFSLKIPFTSKVGRG